MSLTKAQPILRRLPTETGQADGRIRFGNVAEGRRAWTDIHEDWGCCWCYAFLFDIIYLLDFFFVMDELKIV